MLIFKMMIIIIRVKDTFPRVIARFSLLKLATVKKSGTLEDRGRKWYHINRAAIPSDRKRDEASGPFGINS